MRFIHIFAVMAVVLIVGEMRASAQEKLGKFIELWPNGAPGAAGNTDEDKPAILPFLPDAKDNTGAAILICPGGGFTTRCVDFEGVEIAQWFQARGIAGFVLRYRIRPMYGMQYSMADAERAMQYLRANAEEFHIDPRRIGIIGFSAGAELAAASTFKPLEAKSDDADPLMRFTSRPDFLVLAYGSSRLPSASDQKAPPPPTFMFCTAEDMGHLRGMMDLYGALTRAHVPAEAHFFASGEHGVGFPLGDPVLGQWPDLLFSWIKGSGFLVDQPRVALQGIVKLDGQPLPRGYVIFTPIDSPHAPTVVARIFNTGPVRGQISFDAKTGPVPGKYRIQVRQDATRWVSNSRDPIQLKMNQKMRAGTFTDADKQEWITAARQRDLSPSIEGQRIYDHVRPSDGKEMIIEIPPTGKQDLVIEIFSQ
ncbi:MAG TPA: alpha/beta hydrolase [Tepidisphaeraceae bacterium]|nr:alpha/beta hydrolase [Tepidisphaeraceae bacterium]